MSALQKIVIIGSGTGGTIMANRLHRKLKKKAEVTIIDPGFKLVYQPGFLFTMFGKDKTKNLIKDARKYIPKQVNAVEDRVTFVDTETRTVITEKSGDFPYDYLVIASGVNLAFDSIDWWDDSIHQFYTPEGAEKLHKAIENFEEGQIVVSIADLPYKCPPAPVEAAMLLDDYYRKKNLRDKVKIAYTSPLGRAFSIETTNTRVEPYLKEKDIDLYTFFNTDDVDTEERIIYSMEDDDIEYDMLVMVPPHKGQDFLVESKIASGKGWIPTDRFTLQVKDQERMYAMGDATDIPTSKAGSTAHHEAPVIVQNIADEIDGKEISAKYDGHVQCFFLTEFGKSMFIDFDYENPPKPSPTRSIWYQFKKLFKPVFFRLVVTGRI
ncbi:MAG: NAD(P)/FAD-dependent oxidoreductase [Candidatus Kariarchaeaceae archaeon]|jgi:sulfide:quinone oxidoreductase